MQIDHFDLNLLRSLDALLRERNVTRAAARVHITQQAMSGALRRLRDQFGDNLLVRSGRTMRLTPQAEALVEPVRAAMLQIEQTLHTRFDFTPAASRQHFTVAMSDYAAMTLLPAVAGRLSVEAPQVVLEVTSIDGDTVSRLEHGGLDLCLLPSDWTLFGQRAPRDVRSTLLYEDDFV